MDEDEPGAVDARSIYIGNVRTHLPTGPVYAKLSTPEDVCGKSVRSTSGLRSVWTMNEDHNYLS
jgi:hypothetical protein